MKGFLAGCLIMRTAQAFAIDGDDAFDRLGESFP
jgi:hypothetical protein